MLAVAVSLALVACARPPVSDRPDDDRKIPRPPGVITWTYEAVLDATPEEVWTRYLDLERYPQWNPFILEAVPRTPRAGGPQVGDTIDIRVALAGRERAMWHRVYELTPPAPGRDGRFCWRDGGASTALVTGARCRVFARVDGGRTRFTQRLTIGGSARELARRRYGPALEASLRRETEALRAELTRRRDDDERTTARRREAARASRSAASAPR